MSTRHSLNPLNISEGGQDIHSDYMDVIKQIKGMNPNYLPPHINLKVSARVGITGQNRSMSTYLPYFRNRKKGPVPTNYGWANG